MYLRHGPDDTGEAQTGWFVTPNVRAKLPDTAARSNDDSEQ